MDGPMTDEPLLELIFAVMLPAIGSAILFRIDASTGGTDIVAMIVRKYTHMDIGQCLLASDILITLAAFFVFGPKTGLLSILGLSAKSIAVDAIMENMNRNKYFTIITTEPQAICDYIVGELHRGATIYKGEGYYTHETGHRPHRPVPPPGIPAAKICPGSGPQGVYPHHQQQRDRGQRVPRQH